MKTEYKFLNYFNMRSFFLGVGLSRILSSTKEMFFISIILGTILGIIILKLMNISIKKRMINVLICSILFIMALIILSNMISSMYLTEMPKFMVGIPIIIVILYTLKQQEKVIFKITNILIVINILFFVLSIIALILYIKLINFSYTDVQISNILLSSLEYAFLSTTPIIISKDEKFKDVSVIKTYVISSVTMSILFAITLGILGSNMASVYRYPEYIILKRITLFNNSANLENIICLYWIFDVLMFLITCSNRIKDIIGVKKASILIIGLLFITSFFNSDYIYIIFIYKYTYIVFGTILLLLYLFNKKRLKA